jgi:hypothetical protein
MGRLPDRLGLTTKAERKGVHLDLSAPHREIRGPKDFAGLLRALDGWLPDGSLLYFEGGHPDAEIEAFMADHAVPEPVHIALGTIWPKPRVFQVPATSATLGRLAEIMERHAEPQLAVHFHVHRDGAVLLEWHDAFSQQMMVAGSLSDEAVAMLVDRFRSAGSR